VAETDQRDSVVKMLDELVTRIGSLTRAHTAADLESYAALRTKLYEQGDMLAATLNASQGTWRQHIRSLIDQIENLVPVDAIMLFERSSNITPKLFIKV